MRAYQQQKIPGLKSRLREGVTEGMAIHPIVRFIWEQINHQRASQEDIAERSGVAASTMRKWRDGVRSPRMVELESVVNALGYELKVTLKEENR